jgi:hypothetical protein
MSPLPVARIVEFSGWGGSGQHQTERAGFATGQIPVQRENNREFFVFSRFAVALAMKISSQINLLQANSRSQAKREFIRA